MRGKVTHADSDHSGNAGLLIVEVSGDEDLRASFSETRMLYHNLPKRKINPFIRANGAYNSSQEPVPGSTLLCYSLLRCSAGVPSAGTPISALFCELKDMGWLQTMKGFGFRQR